MFFQNVLDRAARNMPFRMTLGKLGIRLVAIGRWLQVRYANWNSEFRLKCEVFEKKIEMRDFHVSTELISVVALSFYSRDAQPEKQTEMVKQLFAIRGVTTVQLHPYKIRIEKARVFGWEELQPEIETTILKHLTAQVV